MKNRLSALQLTSIISLALCFGITAGAAANYFLELVNMTAEIMVSLILGFVSFLGVLIPILITTTKEGKTTAKIKEDTSDVRPKVDNIEEGVKKANSVLVERVAPSLETTKETDRKVQELVEELHFQKWLKTNVPFPENKETIFAQINQLYEQLAAYKEENNRLNNEQLRWIERSNQLMIENAHLQKRLERYEPKAVTPPIEPDM
ncbi:MAG: hypothetical protein IJW89_03665 [Clostridia bacterium]|nr:hypothetical protein [Clostridia bacterium]